MRIERTPCDVSAYFEKVDLFLRVHIWSDVLNWLHDNNVDTTGFAQPVSADSFRAIFERLLALADPDYEEPVSDQSWHDFAQHDIFRALERISYPYAVRMTAVGLASPSEPCQWPRILAIFYWLAIRGKVEQIESCYISKTDLF